MREAETAQKWPCILAYVWSSREGVIIAHSYRKNNANVHSLHDRGSTPFVECAVSAGMCGGPVTVQWHTFNSPEGVTDKMMLRFFGTADQRNR